MEKQFSDEFWNELLKRIKEFLDKTHRPASEILMDDVDLREFLKISRRTSLEYRRRKYYPFYKLDGKIYYVLSEVIEGVKKSGGNYEN